MDDHLRTLDYWADVEALTPPPVEKETSARAAASDPDDVVFHVREGRLPWEAGLRPKRPCIHYVRFGIVDRVAYERELRTVLSAHPEPWDPGGRRRREPLTFMGVIEVAADLRTVTFDPLRYLAAFAPAFARLRGVDVDGYEEAMRLFVGGLSTSIALSDDAGITVDIGLIRAVVAEACRLLDWAPPLSAEIEAVVLRKATETREGRPRAPEIAPINGFYLDDIRKARRALKDGAACGVVSDYLADGDEDRRIDCMDRDAVDAALSLDRLPPGRWPSAFPLTLMQQVAVNEGLGRLTGGGLFSVNGPPGTGKTTLLADVAASVYVSRAIRLAEFARPRDAFSRSGPGPMAAPEGYALHPDLRDFTMVVASSNNGAVENVTRELPDIGKLAPAYQSGCSIFRETATALLNGRPVAFGTDTEDLEEQDDESPGQVRAAWGLFSVPLGKGSNRRKFQSVVYAKEKVGPGRPSEDAPHNLFRSLDELPQGGWRRACDGLAKAISNVESLKAELRELESLEGRLASISADREQAQRMLIEASDALVAANAAETKAVDIVGGRTTAVIRADAEAAAIKPGRFIRLLAQVGLSTGAASAFRAHDAALSEQVSARSRLREAEAEADIARDRTASCRSALEAARVAFRDGEDRRAASGSRIDVIQARHPGLTSMPTREDFVGGREEVQQRLPRSSDSLNEARAEVFAAAVSVHKAFLGGAKAEARRNLSLALRMLSGKTRPDADEALDLWASLALLVPVVSSTFAAFGRCFATMPAGGIGWLVVDEAGQAVPQAPVGALMRAKRVLVVGDPLQVEPVITLDERTDQRLQERHGARRIHRSTEASMQSLADRINPFGTVIHGTERDVWVGSPLLVHRRCVEPMFSISNDIAYDGGMVLGAGNAEAEDKLTLGDLQAGLPPRPLLGPSCWIDVANEPGDDGHFMPSHAAVALAILRFLVVDAGARGRDGLPDAYVVSPFKTVAEGMQEMLDPARKAWASGVPVKRVNAWLGRSVGTVHTFQGKEAETVVLLLGGRTSGAIEWAASTPNILNVAVTRARRRLYVVGDWQAWMVQPRVRSSMGTIPRFRVPGNEFKNRLAAMAMRSTGKVKTEARADMASQELLPNVPEG